MINLSTESAMKLLNTFMEGNHLEELTDCASHYLRNPLSVFDTSYHIVAYSKTYRVDDYIWMDAVKRGYWSYEFVAKVHRRIDRAATKGARAAIVEGIGPLRRRIAELELDGIHLGYFVVLEANCPLEDVTDEEYQFAAGLLAKELCAERPIASSYVRGKTCESILMNLLNSSFPNRMLFHERISGTELETLSACRLLVLDMQHYSAAGYVEEELRHAITRYLPHSWSVFDERHVVILVDIKQHADHTEFVSGEFSDYLKERKIRAALSDGFSDLYLLPDYHIHAVRTLELSFLCHVEKPVICCNDFKLIQMISEFSSDRIHYFCADAATLIWDYDVQNKTDYLKTLFYYLHAGRSIQRTAEILIVHRNTVIYRIERIKELFHLSLDDTYHNVQMYVSCIALYYNRIVNAEHTLPPEVK